MWRVYRDVEDSWDTVTDIINFYAQNKEWFSNYTGPGGWALKHCGVVLKNSFRVDQTVAVPLCPFNNENTF